MSWVQKRIGQGGAVSYTATYRDPAGRGRSAGTFTSRREAERAGRRAKSKVGDGSWLDRTAGRITFEDYVEGVWWPSRHLEVSTRAGYRSNLDKHFLPYFGAMTMADILPSTVQGWVTAAVAAGLSARSVVKYHVMLHGVFKRAVRDRVIGYNPCADTELPKVIPAKVRIVAPEDFDRLLAEIPARHEALVLTAIEAGLRWGELIALRPRHVDFLRRLIVVEETVVEVSKRHSPTGERMIVKPYPKNDETRTLRVSPALVKILASRISALGSGAITCCSRRWRRRAGHRCHATRSAPRCGCRHCRGPTSVSRSGCTTCATHTHPGGRGRSQNRDGPDGAQPDPDHAEVSAFPA